MSATRAQIRQSIARSARLTALIAESETHGGEMLHGGFLAGALAKPGAEPKWNTIFPRGTWHGPNFARMGGSFTVDDAFLSEVVLNWEAAGKPRIPVRWGHEHMKATPEAKRALDRKAGNVTDLRITAAGLEGLTDWNAEGAADVSNGTFDGWSAEWWPKHVNRLTGETRGWYLSGVALTNEPYFELLPRIAASLAEPATNPNTEQQMNPEALKKWALSLGLPADATIEQCAAASQSAVTASAEKLKALETKVTALTASAITPEVIAGVVKPVQDQVEALTAQLAEEKQKGLERDVDALIATAKRGDGKTGRAITDPLVLVAKNIAKSEGTKACEAFLAAIPLSVPIQATSQQGTTDGPLTAAAANAKIATRAEELRKAGDPTPTLTAMREMPNETLIAENRRPTTTTA